jgi:MarR-like DNA-binding transcriptional regulator SgrR of sgrS sRNA
MLWALALLFFLAPAAPAQTAATATTLTLDQQEEFLAKAKIIKEGSAKKGITNTVRQHSDH